MAGSSAQPADRHDSLREALRDGAAFAERLPMLRIVLDQAATLISEGLQNLSTVPVQLTLRGIEGGVALEHLSTDGPPGLVAVLHAANWDGRVLVSVDRNFVLAIVESLLGGDGSELPDVVDRPPSKIETSIMRSFFDRVGSALRDSFANVAETDFVVEALADRVNPKLLGRRDSFAVVATFRLDGLRRSGSAQIIIPQLLLNPMRHVLAQVVTDETPAPDKLWAQKIQSRITRTDVTLRAVLEERLVPLQEVADLTVGGIIELSVGPNSRVRAECNGEPLLWCQLGKLNGSYSLRVDSFIDQQQEFVDHLLAGR